ASVLATVKRDGIEAKGGKWSKEEEQEFKRPLLEQYEEQGHPYYATARLWDDGVITPEETRRTLALAISASLNAPIEETRFGVFRLPHVVVPARRLHPETHRRSLQRSRRGSAGKRPRWKDVGHARYPAAGRSFQRRPTDGRATRRVAQGRARAMLHRQFGEVR